MKRANYHVAQGAVPLIGHRPYEVSLVVSVEPAGNKRACTYLDDERRHPNVAVNPCPPLAPEDVGSGRRCHACEDRGWVYRVEPLAMPVTLTLEAPDATTAALTFVAALSRALSRG